MTVKIRRAISIVCILILAFGCLPPVTPQAAGASVSRTDTLRLAAVDFIKGQFVAGAEIDGFAAYVLALSGENIDDNSWRRGGKSLLELLQQKADLFSDRASLITYIAATQNPGGSFGPFANEYGTKAPLQALGTALPGMTVHSEVYARAGAAITEAVSWFRNLYDGGTPYVAAGWSFDSRVVEALAAAGEDLSAWIKDGESLYDKVVASAVYAASYAEGFTAPVLAKELSALHAVNPSHTAVGELAEAIAGRQSDVNGSLGASVYEHVAVLIALGRAGQLDVINQADAFAYLSTFRTPHQNVFGMDAGAAYGGWSPKESDLTAQVLTALSYFTGADTEGNPVHTAIAEGLAYLADIQDRDTAAIPDQWDSTFTSAETLLALLANGIDCFDSPWSKKTRTRTVAQYLLALHQAGDGVRSGQLAGMLAGRQVAGGAEGAGSFENSVYSDMWAYIALGTTGYPGLIDTDAAIGYILSKQDADGSFGETFFGTYYADFLSTVQALRSLFLLGAALEDEDIDAALAGGHGYLRSLLQPDGGVYMPWDDPVVDNSEVIVMLVEMVEDPSAGYWTTGDGKNPLTFLSAHSLNPDGSFGSMRNIYSAAQALHAVTFLTAAGIPVPETGESSGGGGILPPPQESLDVQAAVVGKNGELLFGPAAVFFASGNPWGETALGALHATGLPYSDDGGFVRAVAGHANAGMMGWMYKINEIVPGTIASQYAVRPGDKVIWWYSTNPSSGGPTWAQLLEAQRTGAPVPVNGEGQKLEQLSSLAGALAEKLAAGTLAPQEALAELSLLMSAETRDFLVDPDTDGREAAEFVLFVLDGVFGALAAHPEAFGQQLYEAMALIMENGVAVVLAGQATDPETISAIKSKAASAARKVYSRAARIPAGQLKNSDSPERLRLTVTQGALQTAINLGNSMRSRVLALLAANGLGDVSKELEAERLRVVEVDIRAREKGDRGIAFLLEAGAENVLKNSGIRLKAVFSPGFAVGVSSLRAGGESAMLVVDRLTKQEEGQVAAAITANTNQHLKLRSAGGVFRLALQGADGKRPQGALAPAQLELLFAVEPGPTKELSGIYRFKGGSFQFAGASGNTGREMKAPLAEDGIYLPLVYDRSFADMPAHWAAEEVRFMGARHVTRGVSATDFAPQRSVTRAEAASFLVRALSPAAGNNPPVFGDVRPEAWYAGDVSAAAASGLLAGRAGEVFAPGDFMTRMELAVILSRVMTGGTVSGSPSDVLAGYSDSGEIPEWAVAGVAEAVRLGLIRGRSAHELAPRQFVTRAEAMAVLARMLRMQEAQTHVY
jgi:hypothetical protein